MTGPSADAAPGLGGGFACAAATDAGRVRSVNQDYAWTGRLEVAGSRRAAALVADGMGGGVRGEEASRVAAEAAVAALARGPAAEPQSALVEAVGAAHDAVLAEHARLEIGDAPFATTLVVALVDEPTAIAWLANVGDSRGYLLGPHGIARLTRDHSIVAERLAAGRITEREAREASDRSVITRAVGARERLQIDLFGPAVLQAGETLLLCSDGVHGMLDDTGIARIAATTPSESLPDALVAAANEAGGLDNISVALVARLPAPEPAGTTRWRLRLRGGSPRVRWPMQAATHAPAGTRPRPDSHDDSEEPPR